MYCIRCGKKLDDGMKYCTRCGAPVREQRRDNTNSAPEQGWQEDDFTIRIPQDYIQAETAAEIRHMMDQDSAPDETDEDSVTRAMAREEIREVMVRAETQPDEADEDSVTRAMAREEIREVMVRAEAQPDEADEDSVTRAMAREEIREVMDRAEAQPDETDEDSVTRAMVSEEIREVMDEAEAQPDEAGDEEYTQMIARDEIHAALAEQREEEETPPIDVASIPDIPIPSDFIAPEAPRYYTPPAPYVPAEHTVHRLQQEQEEPLLSGRGLLFVIIVVIALFAVAVGAFLLALNSPGTTDAGSGSAEIGFWSADIEE